MEAPTSKDSPCFTIQGYNKLINGWLEFLQKIGSISPDGLVTLSFTGTEKKIKREHITKWTDLGAPNFFTFMLADHKADFYYIDRSAHVADLVLDLLRGNTLNFGLLSPFKQVLLLEEIKFYQMEAVAAKHLLNWNQILHEPLQPVCSPDAHLKIRFLVSPGRVLYLTQGNQYCLQEKALGPDLTNKITRIEPGCFTNYDVVVINTYSGVDNTMLGNLLAEFVDGGGSVVICYFSNTTSYSHPAGKFTEYHPFKLKVAVSNTAADWLDPYSIPKSHPLMQDVRHIMQKADLSRSDGELNPGDVEVVAKWANGANMIAIRHDKKGLITSLGFLTGDDYISGDVQRVLMNAIRLRKR